MSSRLAVLLTTTLFIVVVPAMAERMEVTYLSGTVQAIAGNSGAILDTTPSSLLQLRAGKTEIAIPYRVVTSYEYHEENRFRLGVLATIGVSLLKARSKRHTVTVGWTDDSGVSETATFETSRDSAQGLIKVLDARAPQVCKVGKRNVNWKQ